MVPRYRWWSKSALHLVKGAGERFSAITDAIGAVRLFHRLGDALATRASLKGGVTAAGERPPRLRAGYEARSGFRTTALDPAVLLARALHALRAAEEEGSEAGAIRQFVSRPTPQ